MNGRRLLVSAAACGLVLVCASAPASAQPLEKGHFHDVFTDSFDCDGTPTEVDGDVSGNFNFVRHGSALAYYRESLRGTVVYTNLTQRWHLYRRSSQRPAKTSRVTDNGDGTLTIAVQEAGSSRWYDTDGNFVLADAGNFHFQFMLTTAVLRTIHSTMRRSREVSK